MSINPDPFDPIRPNSQMDGFLAHRMGCALWLTRPETGAETMTTEIKAEAQNVASNRCIEPGCTKFRVKNKRCSKHSKEFLAAQGAGPEPKGVKPAEAKEAGATDPREGAGLGVEEQPALRSLLQLVDEVSHAPAIPGFFVDFTGHEDLLQWVETLSDDPAQDVIALLDLVKSGKFCRRG